MVLDLKQLFAGNEGAKKLDAEFDLSDLEFSGVFPIKTPVKITGEILSKTGIVSGITMVFVPSVSTFAISKMLGGGTELLLGDLIEQQFLGGAYNPQLGAAISLVMMVIVVVCMAVMNRFGEGEEQAVML